MSKLILPELFTPLALSKIRWKSQIYTHLFFGLWMGILASLSWNVGLSAVIKVAIVYIALYALVYIPLFAVLPYKTLKPLLKKSSNLKGGVLKKEEDAQFVVEFLSKLPLRGVKENIFVTMSAFTLGSFLWLFNVIPELQGQIKIAIFQTVALGAIVTIIESLYNFVFIQEKSYIAIESVLSEFPNLARKQLLLKKATLQTKFLVLFRGVSIVGQFSLILFIGTYLATSGLDKELVNQIILFIIIVLFLNLLTLLLIAPKVAHVFIQPLKILGAWSESVSRGNVDSTVNIRTTDEIDDVIVQSNRMVHQLLNEQSRLKEERNKLEAVVEGIVDSVIAIDSKNRITFANKQTYDLFGVSNTELIQKDPGKRIFIFDSSNTDITYRIFSKTDRSIARSELRLVDANAQSKYVNIVNTPISSKSDETSYVIAIHDITKEKAFEQMKVDFVSMAAHELRTPLTSVTGYLATLQEEMSGFSEDHQLFINRSYESAQQLMELVDDLLSISRIERGVLKLEKVPTDWDDLLKEAVEDSSHLAQEKNITINIIKPEIPLPRVEVDKPRIKEILHNLISNAIKYSPEKTLIKIHTEREENVLITHITDNGIGIPKESIKQLFSKFYRVPSDSKDAHTGTGLGLYISKAIIEMHNGEIWVDSQVGKGSTFSFSVPIQSPDST